MHDGEKTMTFNRHGSMIGETSTYRKTTVRHIVDSERLALVEKWKVSAARSRLVSSAINSLTPSCIHKMSSEKLEEILSIVAR